MDQLVAIVMQTPTTIGGMWERVVVVERQTAADAY